jgi:hypothetical protein
VIVKLEDMSLKVERFKSKVEKIKETNNYFVKVADSCPIAVENKRI